MDKTLELAQALLNAVVRLEHQDTNLTFNEANRIRRVIAVVLGMSDQELARKMAEYYCCHRSQLEAPDTRHEIDKIEAIVMIDPHGEGGDWPDGKRCLN